MKRVSLVFDAVAIECTWLKRCRWWFFLSWGLCEPPVDPKISEHFPAAAIPRPHPRTMPALSASRIYGAPLDTPPDGSSIFREPTFRHFGSVLPNAHKHSHLPDVLRELVYGLPPAFLITETFNKTLKIYAHVTI